MNCKECNSEYTPKRSDSIFCSPKCKSSHAYTKMKRERGQYKSIDQLTKEDVEKIINARPDLKIKID